MGHGPRESGLAELLTSTQHAVRLGAAAGLRRDAAREFSAPSAAGTSTSVVERAT